ncbi:MAG TPA: dipeptide epimerase [Elusimicrobiota bacterium]|nr:dipeptide epimerase [Elusimicrobiota bacterium]
MIRSVDVRAVSYPLLHTFVTAAGRKSRTQNVDIRLSLSDGTAGVSEASSSIAMRRESQPAMIESLRRMIPDVCGRAIGPYRALGAEIWRRHSGHPTAAAAMECAIVDAYARTRRRPLWRLFGGAQTSVETDLTLSVASPGTLARRVRSARRKGFRKFKVKLAGRRVDEDLARLRAVAEAAPGARIVADGNQGFNVSKALELAARLDSSGISIVFFEQPFPKQDLAAMRLFRRRSTIPLVADESVLTPADAERLLSGGAADGVNIKIAKSGLAGALKIIRIARRLKKMLAIGCMEESKIGLAASVHLACGTGVFEWIDLDSVFLMKSSRVRGGFTIKGATLSVRGIGPGIGI